MSRSVGLSRELQTGCLQACWELFLSLRLQAPADPQSEPPQNTHDDGASGETQARNDLVSVTEKREKTSEPRGSGRTLSSPTEEPLLKRKDAPRPRQKDGGDVPLWRERPT